MQTRISRWALPIAFGSVIASASADTILWPGQVWCYPSINTEGKVEKTCENVLGEDIPAGNAPDSLPEAVIRIKSATYGLNRGARHGNQTGNLTEACDGRVTCDYTVDYTVIGDPVPGCAKKYTAQSQCSYELDPIVIKQPALASTLQAEAGFGSVLHLDCYPRIKVVSATYGLNCGAPQGNQTANLAGACDGRFTCDYTVDYTVIGDPAPGCAKDYTVQNQCSTKAIVRVAKLDGEAGYGGVAHLSCQ